MRQENNSMKALIPTILLLLLLLLAGLNGCASVRLYPIAKQDIVKMPKGQSYTPDRDGYFVSKFYVKEIMGAEVEDINLK